MAAVENRVRGVCGKRKNPFEPDAHRCRAEGCLPGLGKNVTLRLRRPCSNSSSFSSSISSSSKSPVVDWFNWFRLTERVVISNSWLRPHEGCCFFFHPRRNGSSITTSQLLPGGTYLGLRDGPPHHQYSQPATQNLLLLVTGDYECHAIDPVICIQTICLILVITVQKK